MAPISLPSRQNEPGFEVLVPDFSELAKIRVNSPLATRLVRQLRPKYITDDRPTSHL